MICHECNSPDFDVTVKEELGYDNDPVDLGLEVTHCPFCGANLEWAQRLNEGLKFAFICQCVP